MEQNLNSARQFNLVVVSRRSPSKSYGDIKSLAELAGLSAPDYVSESTPSSIHLSKYPKERENAVNSAFANLLVGIRVGDEPRQKEAYNILMRIARSIALKSGYKSCSCSDDYKEIANNCLAQEVQRHRHLTALEIVGCCEAKKFAYLWKAFKSDFVDEIRKFHRRKTVEEASVLLAGQASRLDSHWDESEYELTAEEYRSTAQSLPVGPAAIAEALGELYRNPDQLLELTSPELSQRSCKTRFVKSVAKCRRVDTQVVRKDLKQFKDHARDPEYARIAQILRGTSPQAHAFCFNEGGQK